LPDKREKAMQVNTNQKLISCILPRGTALDVLQKLKDEKNIIEASVHNARGMGKLTPQAHRGIGEQTEKELLNVAVPGDRAEELFEYIYDIANINRPHGGIIYMCKLQQSSPFIMPDLPEEKE